MSCDTYTQNVYSSTSFHHWVLSQNKVDNISDVLIIIEVVPLYPVFCILYLVTVSATPFRIFLPADSFSKYKTKVILNKVCIMRLYIIKYCIFRVIWLIFRRNFTSYVIDSFLLKMSEMTRNILNCVKSHYAHFIRNYFSLTIRISITSLFFFFSFFVVAWAMCVDMDNVLRLTKSAHLRSACHS